MQKEFLEKLIIETDKKNEKRKPIRFIKAYILFVVLYSVLYYCILDDAISEIIILALVTAAIFLPINAAVFIRIINASNEENARLESLKKKYYDEYGGYM